MTAIDFAASSISSPPHPATPSCRSSAPRSAVENKKVGGFDPVTAADRAAEQAMRTLIRKHFPDHGILGEEYGCERTDAEYVWVLDPIDGTKSFISGMVAWGTLIGLMRFGEPVFGMMHQPFTRERFSGDGGAARYRGPAGKRDLHVRACPGSTTRCCTTTSPLLMNRADRAAFGAGERGEALALRRRLLRLLHAGGRPDRPHHRDRDQAARHRAADPDRHRRRRHRHTWENGPAQPAAASSSPATGACMRRR